MSKPAFALEKTEVMRAEEEWQRAGAYSVRIEGMNRQHHISLREEFDEHDGPGTRYIVLLDEGYPVATCRFFEAGCAGERFLDEAAASSCANAGAKGKGSAYAGLSGLVMVGRVVVLEEYRGCGLGAKTIREAEKWIRELGYEHIGVDSRLEAVGFYEKLGYRILDPEVVISGPFECMCMAKEIKAE